LAMAEEAIKIPTGTPMKRARVRPDATRPKLAPI